jgi:hypothetical protein
MWHLLTGCGKTPFPPYSREGGSPERFEKTGFSLPRERHSWMEKDFFSNLLKRKILSKNSGIENR